MGSVTRPVKDIPHGQGDPPS